MFSIQRSPILTSCVLTSRTLVKTKTVTLVRSCYWRTDLVQMPPFLYSYPFSVPGSKPGPHVTLSRLRTLRCDSSFVFPHLSWPQHFWCGLLKLRQHSAPGCRFVCCLLASRLTLWILEKYPASHDIASGVHGINVAFHWLHCAWSFWGRKCLLAFCTAKFALCPFPHFIHQ